MNKLFISEVNKEVEKYSLKQQEPDQLEASPEIITERDIAKLPEPVQRFFRYSGYLGRPRMRNAMIEWKDFRLKLSPKQPWRKFGSKQFNSVPEPARVAYMYGRIMGVIPFEGRDKYQDGHGNMRITLCNVFKVAEAKGREMDQSGLVTILAEAFFVPSYALQPYIEWTPVDERTANATICFNGEKAEGSFHFNDEGAFIRFESNDRYYSEKGTEYKQLKWTVTAGNYLEKNGTRIPTCFTGSWTTPEGEYEYFKGTISSITFDIE